MGNANFYLEVKLASNGDQNILTPFKIKDFAEYAAGTTNNQDHIAFNITLSGNRVDKLTVKIKGRHGIIYQQQLPASMRQPGTHKWQWDGFDAKSIYTSKRLKGDVSVEFTAMLGARKKTSTVTLSNHALEQDWLDITVNKITKVVNVDFRLEFNDGGAQGVGEMPPQEVQTDPAYNFSSLPAHDPRKQTHTRVRSYADLRTLAINGIKKYWSRKVTFLNGGTYTVTVNPRTSGKKVMDYVSLTYNSNRNWLRSSNPGSVRGVISLFGNIAQQQIAYNVGWVKYSNGWYYDSPTFADRDFEKTAAHEIGHEILSAYGGEIYSYKHKGTSTITQKTKTVADGGEAYPAKGEIDIMKYYDALKQPKGYYSRIIASEKDVKSLLWLTRVKFESYTEEDEYGD